MAQLGFNSEPGLNSEPSLNSEPGSAIQSKRPIAPWKQVHHWQGLGLVLLMVPLGSSLLLGSAFLEQANRQGLPEAGWTDDFAQNIASSLPGNSLAKVAQWADQGLKHWRNHDVPSALISWMPHRSSVDERPSGTVALKPVSLRRRQRRILKQELSQLSQQTHQRLDEAISKQASDRITARPGENLEASTFAPAVAQSQNALAVNQGSSLSLSIAPDLRHNLSHRQNNVSQHNAIHKGVLQNSAIQNSTFTQANLFQPSPEEVAHFLDIALGAEFSPRDQPVGIPHIRKWTQDLRIRVNGYPTATDIATLEQVVAEINHLLGGIELGFVERDPNLEIFFVAERDFSQYEATYQPINHGFFWSEAAQGSIQRGRILISTTEINQAERSHLIREELTQSLGLMQDSSGDVSSIFYQGWSQTQAYTPQDRQLLQMLYRPDILPGMDAGAVQRVLLGS